MKPLSAVVLDEPDLVFGQHGIEKDPRLGLGHYGPFHTTTENAPSPSQIRLGLIGKGEDIAQTKMLFKQLANYIPSGNTNKWLSPDFPGFNQGTKIACDFLTADQWNATITDHEVRELEAYTDPNERIAKCADLYIRKIASVLDEDDMPHVFVCVLPQWIEDYCGRSKFTRGASIPQPTSAQLARGKNRDLSEWGVVELPEEKDKDYDLRNALKGKAMSKTLKQNIPIQILRESTLAAMLKMLRGEATAANLGLQPPSEFAWNFCTAIYYKANGKPWRLFRLPPGTCYVGICFFRDKRSVPAGLQFSMAQVFTHSLEGFVIRGTEVTVDEHTLEPHMSERQAYDLLTRAIKRYEDRADCKPTRVVVHKTSSFSDAERAGIARAIGPVKKDLVAFTRTDARFIRAGAYPPLRGTLIPLSTREYLLYTSGYIPRLRTYPGAHVPEPVLIRHDGDTEFDKVCKEVLGLTKLDWNTAAFATSTPITISFAQRVGDILSELKEDRGIQDQYRFYM